MGGIIAQTFVSRFPKVVNKLVLVSTASNHTFMSSTQKQWPSDLEGKIEALKRYFSPNFAEKNMLLVKAMAKMMQKSSEQASESTDAQSFDQGSQLQKLALKGFNLDQQIKSIGLPTLIIHGLEDQIIPAQAAKHIQKLIPNSKLNEIEKIGHLLLAECPKYFYQEAFNFLNE